LAALQKSRGEVLVFFDDDDEFLPEKLQRTYNVFSSTERQGGETGYYRHDRIIVGPDGAEVKEYRKRETEYIRKVGSFSVGKPLSERDANRLLLSGAYAYTSAIAIRKAAVTPFASYLPSVETSHDLFLFFCALLSQYNLYVDSARLCRYTLHDLNTSIFKYQKSKAELEDAVLKFFQKEVRTFEAIRKMQSELRSDSDPVVEKLLGYELYSRKVDLNMVDPSSSRRRVMSDATKFLTRYSFRTTRGSQLKIYVRCVLRVLFPKTAKRIFVKRFSS
jgi:glycosyltransferase involved in cell wall biosynthesis